MAFVFALVFLGTTALSAATIYVATDGNDLYDGTVPEYTSGTTGPMRTISAAIAKAAAGDVIVVEAGIYNTGGDAAFTINKGVTFQVRADGGNTVVFVPTLTLASGAATATMSTWAGGASGTFRVTGGVTLTSGVLNLANAGILEVNDGVPASPPQAIAVTQGTITGNAPNWSDADTYTFLINAGAAGNLSLNLEVPTTVTTFTNNRAAGTLTVASSFTVTTGMAHSGASAATFSGAVNFTNAAAFLANPGAGNFTGTGAWSFTNGGATPAITANSGTGAGALARTTTLAAVTFNATAGGAHRRLLITTANNTLAFTGAVSTTATAPNTMDVSVDADAAETLDGDGNVGTMTFAAAATLGTVDNAGSMTFSGPATVRRDFNNAGTVTNNSTIDLNGIYLPYFAIGTVNGTAGTLRFNQAATGINAPMTVAGNVNIGNNFTIGPAATGSTVGGALTITSGTTNVAGAGTALTANDFSVNSGATFNVGTGFLTVNRNFTEGSIGAYVSAAGSRLIFGNAATPASGEFTPAPNFVLNGVLIVNKPGQTITWKQSATVNGPDQVIAAPLPASTVAGGVSVFVAAGNVSFVDENLILPNNTQAIEINGITNADTGGIQFQGLSQVMAGTGQYTNIVVVNGAANAAQNVLVNATNVAFNGTISLVTGGISIAAGFALNAVANSGAKVLRQMTTANTRIQDSRTLGGAGGTMNAAGARYDLEFYGAVPAANFAVGDEITANLNSLIVRTSANSIQVPAAPATIDIAQKLDVRAGAVLNGANPTNFNLSGAGTQAAPMEHPIAGVVGATANDVITMSANWATLKGVAATGGNNDALVPSVVVAADGALLDMIHRVTGNFTTNAGSEVTLTLLQDSAAPADGDNGEIDGNLVVNGDRFTLGANLGVGGAVGVDHNQGLLDLASFNLTVGATFAGAGAVAPGGFDGTEAVAAGTDPSYNTGQTGFLVMNIAGANFGLAGKTMTNVRFAAVTNLRTTSTVSGTMDINSTVTGIAGPAGDVAPDLVLTGNALVAAATPWASTTAGAFTVRGSTITGDGGAAVMTWGNFEFDSPGTTTFASINAVTRTFSLQGTTVHTKGGVAIGSQTLEVSNAGAAAATYTAAAACTTCAFTGTGGSNNDLGALRFTDGGAGNLVVDTNGNDIPVNRLTSGAGAGTVVLTSDSRFSVDNQLRLTGGVWDIRTGNTAPATAGAMLDIADGTNIFRSAGSIDGTATVEGDATNVTYFTVANIPTGSELHSTVNNLTTNSSIVLMTDGSSLVAPPQAGTSKAITVNGTFDVNAGVDMVGVFGGTVAVAGRSSTITLGNAATMNVGINAPFDKAIVPTNNTGNANTLVYDGAGAARGTDNFSWPAAWVPNQFTIGTTGSPLALHANRGAMNVGWAGGSTFDLAGNTFSANGNVTQQQTAGGAAAPVFSLVAGGVFQFTGTGDATWTVRGNGWNGPSAIRVAAPYAGALAATTPYVLAINKAASADKVIVTGGNVNFSHGQGVVDATTQVPNSMTFRNGVLDVETNGATVMLYHGTNGVTVPIEPSQGFVHCPTAPQVGYCATSAANESHVFGDVQKVALALAPAGAGTRPAIHNTKIQFPVGTENPAWRLATLFFPTAPQSDLRVTMSHTGASPGGTDGFPVQTPNTPTAGPLTNYANMYWTLMTDVSLPPSFQFEASFFAKGYTIPLGVNEELVRLIRRHDLNTANDWILQNGTYDNSKDANNDLTVTLRNAAIGGFVTSGIRFTIGEKNVAPTFNVQPAAAVAIAQNNTLTLNYAAADVDIGDTVTLSQVAGETLNGMSFNAATGTLTWNVGFDIAPGPYTVTVRATDSNGATTDATTVVTVTKTNRAPVFVDVLTDRDAPEGTPVSFTYTATDADNDALVFTLTAPVANAAITPAGVLTFSPVFAQAGTVVAIGVTVTDASGATAATTANVSVKHSVGLCDVTMNGQCSALDADWVLQNSAGNRAFSVQQDWAGDVSGANGVTAFDASYILQYELGSITTFPAGDALSTKGGDFGYGDIAWGDSDWSEGVHARVPVTLSGEVDDVYAVTIRTNVDPAVARVASVQVNVPEDWRQLTAYDEETGDLTILAAGAYPIDSAMDLANIQLTMVDEMAQVALAAEAFINEKAPVEIDPIEVRQVPTEYDLAQNYPNPFNPTTLITYSLPEDARVSLEIYDVTGRLVNMLVNNDQEAGRYRVQWDGRTATGSSVASGIYIYRLRAGSFVQSKTMMLVK